MSLVDGSPAAAEPLRFAAGLYRAQQAAAARIERLRAAEPLTGHLERDAARILGGGDEVLRHAAAAGPPGLAPAARTRLEDPAETARTRLLVYWSGGTTSGEDYLSRAILRPYVETLRSIPAPPDRIHKQGRCPFCGGPPWMGVRREGSLMEGARRMLACALCGGEWSFGRILCPSCFEADPLKLPSFTAPPHSNVRIEACETCRRYVKSIDLSEDARPIPEVDDLVSLSLDLWAVGEGFERIEPGLAGV